MRIAANTHAATPAKLSLIENHGAYIFRRKLAENESKTCPLGYGMTTRMKKKM
jgi:hypothetical protein